MIYSCKPIPKQFYMPSAVISTITSNAHLCSQEGEYRRIEYDCGKAPPYFDGHPLFMEPRSRECGSGRSKAIFNMSNNIITLNTTMVKELIDIFVFFKINNLSLEEATFGDFAVQDGHLVMSQP
jgi:hypothetical protein